MTKKTKIIATIGPATESPEIIEQMIIAGMNVARFNTKHNEPEWHNHSIKQVRQISQELHLPIGILLDLQGPEIRIDLPGQKSFEVKRGDAVVFSADDHDLTPNHVIVSQNVIDALVTGNQILLEDGACELTITDKSGTYLTTQADHDCTINPRKTMNTPNVVLNMPVLTDRDYYYLDHIEADLVDWVGLSFVRSARDIQVLQSELVKRGWSAQIIAKIENKAALDNLQEIVQASDVIMIARGDLGVEIPFRELTFWQKKIIQLSRDHAKPVITATEMLKSMINKPRPTRAEVSDVAHAIYDGTDVMMLSDETTIGQYPIKAVQTQTTIAEFNEPHAYLTPVIDLNIKADEAAAVCQAALGIVRHSQFHLDKIICLTETGYTARLMARFHLPLPILAITSNPQTFRQLTILYGVTPFIIDLPESRIDGAEKLIDQLTKQGIVNIGESLLVIHGTLWKNPGLTNTLNIVSVT